MTTQAELTELIERLSEARRREVLRYARFIAWEEEQGAWRRFGRQQLARAYGPDEPEYSLEDVKAELRS